MSNAVNYWWLQQQLRFKKPEVRRQAVEKLALDAAEEALALLLTVAEDPDREVRLAVMKALAQSKDDRVLRPLMNALRDAEPVIREMAVNALERFGDPRCVEALVSLMKDRNAAVRRRAARALDTYGWRPNNDAQRVQRSLALGEYLRAASVGAAAIEPLLAVLKDRACQDRRLAVEALSSITDERIILPLIAALKDDDPHVRVAAIEAFAHLKSPRAVEPLLMLLRDKDPTVRGAAVGTLGKLADASSLDRLAVALQDPHWGVRKCAVDAMARFKDPRAVPPLAQLLDDADHDVREAAVEALAKIGDRSAMERLVAALADAESCVRNAAGAALRRIDPDWKSSEEARRALPTLQSLQSGKDYWVRYTAGDVIQRINNAKASVETAGFIDPAESRRQAAAIEALAVALDDWDADLRRAAAEALARINDPRAEQALARAGQETIPPARRAPAKAMQAAP